MTEEQQRGIGEELQKARIEKGLTLDDIQAQTKIQKRYLQAIENDQLDQLPGQFYERAFTRQYAATVGLDADSLLESHEIIAPTVAPDLDKSRVDADNVTRAGMHRQEESTIEKASVMMPKVILAIVALIVVIVVWAFVANFAGKAKQEPANNSQVSVATSKVASSSSETSATSTSKKQKEKQASSASEKPKTEVAPASVAGTTSTFAVKVPVNEARKLKITGRGASWTQVTNNAGVVLYSGTIQAGETHEVDIPSDNTFVTLQTGNANNLTLQFNGIDAPLNNTGLVWRAVFNVAQK
ncbi:helix-turn-helix domain-containing protein [Weissella diestrammenae]|uniref:Helix-turn-helix domain-containing protein n=1 Tax=Weissella diestrammenae TaxID=1162633 RepID=A0A7G9T5V9_9LACO|nr:RodZ domain-containing protein [Weissella diestrammenae]MCM0582314.1 helix-turn-helix domain-containing protein [Weissella diestrammenae]QNN75484.1 helix-turn-helix domain-containing protein [Weissella diestrammenae]